MATIKVQLTEALMSGEDTTKLICFYQEYTEDYPNNNPIIQCTFDELPAREFDEGYGGVEGEPTIVFSANFIYVRRVYDGSERFAVIPRNPQSARFIPLVGGG